MMNWSKKVPQRLAWVQRPWAQSADQALPMGREPWLSEHLPVTVIPKTVVTDAAVERPLKDWTHPNQTDRCNCAEHQWPVIVSESSYSTREKQITIKLPNRKRADVWWTHRIDHPLQCKGMHTNSVQYLTAAVREYHGEKLHVKEDL